MYHVHQTKDEAYGTWRSNTHWRDGNACNTSAEILGVATTLEICVQVAQRVMKWIFYYIHLLTAIGLTPGGSSTVHIYTQTVHRMTQNKQYVEQHKYFERVRAVPPLCWLYLSICLTTEEKARKNLSQGSRRVPAGTMKIH